MKFRPRLVPTVIVAATVLLGVKVSDIVSIGGAQRAEAQAPSPTEATGAPVDLTSQANDATNPSALNRHEPQAGNAQPGAAPPGAAQPGTAGQPAANQPAANQPGANQPGANQQVGATPAATPSAPAPQTADASVAAAAADSGPQAPLKDPLLLSPAEIVVLQQLSQRRTQLDKRASDLDQQQVVLEAAEKRVDQKIAELQQLQKSIQADVDKENAADDARTQSLVKIYETMKPADAAQIISQLDMPIALQLIRNMKESKTAPILAAMTPAKAQEITTAMAQKPNPASATAPQPPSGP